MKLQMAYALGIHYRQELVRCGKSACKVCARGPAHGPYWFAYNRKGAFLKKTYVGKELPKEVMELVKLHDQGDDDRCAAYSCRHSRRGLAKLEVAPCHG